MLSKINFILLKQILPTELTKILIQLGLIVLFIYLLIFFYSEIELWISKREPRKFDILLYTIKTFMFLSKGIPIAILFLLIYGIPLVIIWEIVKYILEKFF